jgi:predicted nucleic acid-binding protein
VQVVVADTGPLNYLVLIDAIDVLPKLFDKIIIPRAVCDELLHKGTSEAVRAWMAQDRSWLEVRLEFRSSEEDARAGDNGPRSPSPASSVPI